MNSFNPESYDDDIIVVEMQSLGRGRGARALIKKLRDDEKRHHDTLKKLSEKTFFRLDPYDFTVIMRGSEFAEARYKRSKEFWRKKEEQ
jgi:rubrerythrin